jgi:hypothetical protein
MRNDLQFSNIRKASELPAKSRTTQESPLAAQMKKLTKVGQSFLIEGVEIPNVAPTVYATARRLGVKVSLRSEEGGVGVYMTQLAEDTEINTPKRGPGRPRKAA